MRQEELDIILANHKKFRDSGGKEGERANLRGANLENAYLKGANLECAYLEGANLECAYLKGANLECAYLKGANLDNANLRDANLRGANLRGANLQDADFWNADHVVTNLLGAKYNSTTNFPDEFDPVVRRMIKIDSESEASNTPDEKKLTYEECGSNAFPYKLDDIVHMGLTVRDYFAAKALQGMLAHPSCGATIDILIQESFSCADRMIEQRDKPSEYETNRKENKDEV